MIDMNVPADEEINTALEFILRHFGALGFPRTISTKTTDGRQIQVNNRTEALARFKQANYLDCRINAYSKHDIKGDPNFIFIDIDSTDQSTINRILKGRLQSIDAHPTLLFTGRGYHIYQPIKSVSIDEVANFSSSCEPSRQFLKFSEMYLSENKCDPNHNPSFKSCMVRIPNTINSKNGLQVKIAQSWDNKRPNIKLLLGSFYAWLLTKEKKWQEKAGAFDSQNNNSNKLQIKWIETNLLQTALDDHRKTTINLVLAPYLVNTCRLSFDQAGRIIEQWLDICKTKRELDFNPKNFVNSALSRARKSGYKPMSLNTLKQKNCTIYQRLGITR